MEYENENRIFFFFFFLEIASFVSILIGKKGGSLSGMEYENENRIFF